MNRYLPMVILVVFGQALIAYLLVTQVILKRTRPTVPDAPEVARAEITVSDEPEKIYRGLGDFLLNPADTSGEQGFRFLRATVSLGVSPAQVHDELAIRMPKLRDRVVGIFIGKSVAEMDDPEDREFIKDEIKFALERVLRKDGVQGEILQIYFTEFLIQ